MGEEIDAQCMVGYFTLGVYTKVYGWTLNDNYDRDKVDNNDAT